LRLLDIRPLVMASQLVLLIVATHIATAFIHQTQALVRLSGQKWLETHSSA